MKKMILILAALGLLAATAQAASVKIGAPSTKILRSGVTATAESISYTAGNYVDLTAGELLILSSAQHIILVLLLLLKRLLTLTAISTRCLIPISERDGLIFTKAAIILILPVILLIICWISET